MSATVDFVDAQPMVRPLGEVSWPDIRVQSSAIPVSFGMGLEKGHLNIPFAWLEGPHGERLLAQSNVISRWPDGSVRWLLVDAILPPEVDLREKWQVFSGSHPGGILQGAAVKVERRAKSVTVSTGGMFVKISPRGTWQAVACHDSEQALLDADENSNDGVGSLVVNLPQLTDAQGVIHKPVVADMLVVAEGPVRATIEQRGKFPTIRGLNIQVSWSFYADSPLVTGQVTLHNENATRHRGGLWDLGDRGSILFQDFSLAVATTGGGPTSVQLQCEPGQPWQQAVDGQFEVHQESSGGLNWNSANHLNRHGIVPLRYCGYRGRFAGQAMMGERANPAVRLEQPATVVEASIPEFWQQFPKAMDFRDGVLSLRLFPGHFGDLHELQGGEQKTHRIELQLHAGERPSIDSPGKRHQTHLDALPRPSLLPVPALPAWDNSDRLTLARLDEFAEEFLTGPRGLCANRDLVDEFGWRTYGDVHASHEEQYYNGSQPLVSHYNNQFDLLAGCLLQYLRTGDQRWWMVADPLARHVIDIDIYHTSKDRSAYNGGLFWFTDHYLHAHTSTHRTYSSKNRPASGSYGGGPGSEHNFTTGLLLYHYLTGNSLAREAVKSLADWVLAMDDGRQTLLGAMDDGPTGLASRPQSAGRGAANSINALLDGWLLTADRQYLAHAEAIIRRCIHPLDDLAALDLLNAEKCWSYPMFLVSLDKYLRCKSENSEFDTMWAHARDSLVHYGVWMADHEQPYLDRPDKLEYLTEAWAAQEFRKANALRMAAAYAPPGLSDRMQERGNQLATRAWSDLSKFEFRTTTRAAAVVLTEGLRDAELRAGIRAIGCPPSIPLHREPREVFVSQKERVMRKLKSPRGWMSLISMAARRHSWQRLFNHR